MISVSFVIPCYRSRRTLGFTLKSIFSQRPVPDFEVIVVDSSEETVADWIRVHFPTVRVHHPGKRVFPGTARNLGARMAAKEFLAFLDADTVAEPDWLLRMSEGLRQTRGRGVVGGYVANANPVSAASRVLHWVEFSEFLPGLPGGVRPFLSSSNLLVHRESFLVSGGFPEEFPASEDRIYFSRLSAPILFEPGSGVAHYHRTRWGEVLSHLSGLGYWGGVARKTADLPGKPLVRMPWAAWLLPFYRTPAIAGRILRSNLRDGLRGIILSPMILFACLAWASGFHRGLKAPAAPQLATGEE